MKYLYITTGLVIAVILLFAGAFLFKSNSVGASVNDGQGYYSTTTSSAVASTWTEARNLTGTSSWSGILGSVIVTKQTQVTTLNIYDATTTNINLRTGNTATSSILLASFGTSTPVGTYVFDTVYTKGLIVDPTPITGGQVASTTITWR